METEEITPDHIFETFWKDIVCNSDGTINMEALKKELYDFHYAMREVSKVYRHITGNKLSKINYKAEVVIDAADEYYEGQLIWDVEG